MRDTTSAGAVARSMERARCIIPNRAVLPLEGEESLAAGLRPSQAGARLSEELLGKEIEQRLPAKRKLGDERLLAREVLVYRSLGEPGLRGDRVHARPFDSLYGEQFFRRIEHAVSALVLFFDLPFDGTHECSRV